MSRQRYFLELSYNGTAYHGWQIQPNAVTVQEIIDKALSTVLRQPIETLGCGRTDTGVHATQFFAHLDVETEGGFNIKKANYVTRLNAILPRDIAVRQFLDVNNEAHARFDALSRSYEYHVHFIKDPFCDGFSWLLKDVPNISLMNEASKILFEYHDFSCFSKSNTQTFTNNCDISRAEWKETPGGLVFHITANRFLRNMVRAVVGTLIDIGNKKMKPEEIRNVLESKDRSKAGTSVPACGLFLTQVTYPYISTNA